MLEIIISNNSPKPIYEQIKSQIKSQIMSGELAEGTALPSMRGLAKTLSVSVITVQKSYEELHKVGLIETTAGRGSFVSGQNQELVREEKQKELEDLLEQAVELARENGIPFETLQDLLRIFYKQEE
ncbi:MAG: GntR family transcriptional regulator [Eubacteriales bacterium]